MNEGGEAFFGEARLGETVPRQTVLLPPPFVPSECDVCGLGLAEDAHFRPMTLVSDATPRTLRQTRGGHPGTAVIENEWRLEAVCDECHEKFLDWLFGAREDPHEADTIPAPATSPLESFELGIDGRGEAVTSARGG
jgi:5-methylcytosine-specific restriction endonuclease McrA